MSQNVDKYSKLEKKWREKLMLENERIYMS